MTALENPRYLASEGIAPKMAVMQHATARGTVVVPDGTDPVLGIVTALRDGYAHVESRPGREHWVETDGPWAVGDFIWAAAADGSLTTTPQATPNLWIGAARSNTLVEVQRYDPAAVRPMTAWIPLTPTFSAGSAASMNSAATATALVDVTPYGARSIEVGWAYTNGGSAPTANATLAVYRDADGTNYETAPTWTFSETDSASAAIIAERLGVTGSKFKLVLTNSTGQAITGVSMRYRCRV